MTPVLRVLYLKGLPVRPELRIPTSVRLLFMAALALIGLEAAGFIASDTWPVTHIAIAIFGLGAVIWATILLMRFRR